MRILEVIGRLGMGGDTGSVLSALEVLINTGRLSVSSVDFLTHDIGYNRDAVLQLSRRGHKVIILNGDMRKSGPLKYYMSVKKALVNNGPYDIVHVHTGMQSAIVLKAALSCKVPSRICHAHINSVQRKVNSVANSFLTPVFRYMINRYATDRAACGMDAGRFLFGFKTKFRVVKNGIDLRRFGKISTKRIEALREELGIQPSRYIIGHVGRFSDMKNQIFILRLAERLKYNSKFLFVMVGDGENFQKIKDKAEKLRLNCVFPKRREDIEAFMSMFSLHLVPSLPGEGFSITMLEAQAAGCPTICSRHVPRDADMGLGLVEFLPLEDEDKWLDAIKSKTRMRIDPDQCRKIIMEKGYEINDAAEEWAKLYGT